MDIFSSIKNGLSATGSFLWNGIKTIVAPTIISTGRIFTATGQSLFAILSFIKYVTDRDDHPSRYYAGLIGMAFTFIVFIPTRAAAVFRNFRQSPALETGRMPGPMATDKDEIELGCAGSGVSLALKLISYDTLLFMLIRSYAYALTLIEFSAENIFKYDPHKDKNEYITQALAISMALCGTYTYLIYTLKTKAIPNAKIAAHQMETMSFPKNTSSLITLLITGLGTPAVPFTNCFVTYNALGKIPWVQDWSSPVKYTFAGIAAISDTVAHLLTQSPAIYAALDSHQKKMVYTNTACWETPADVVVYCAGVGDLGVNVLLNFNGIVKTSAATFEIAEKHPALIGVTVPFATSTALLNFFFSVHQGYQDTKKHYHQKRGEIQRLDEDPDIERRLVVNERMPGNVYSDRDTTTLFSTSDDEKTFLLPTRVADVTGTPAHVLQSI